MSSACNWPSRGPSPSSHPSANATSEESDSDQLLVGVGNLKDITSTSTQNQPDFPLLPGSKGFCLTLEKNLHQFRSVLNSVGIYEPEDMEV